MSSHLLKNRVKLIRSMIDARKSFPSYSLRIIIDDIIHLVREDKDKYFISASIGEASKISYTRKGSNSNLENVRVKTSLQRFIRRQLLIDSVSISDANLDKFCNLVMLFMDDSLDAKVQIISGNDISNLYAKTMIKSCMTGGCASFKTSIYSLNKNIEMAVFNGEIRALLWTCDDGVKVLDRAYPAGHWGVNFLRAWAKRKGYMVRNVAEAVTDDRNNGISDNKMHCVTIKHEGVFPYMDTFKFGKMTSNNVILSNDPLFGNITFTNTDGFYYERSVCKNCGGSTRNNCYSVNNNNYCYDCYQSECFECSVCNNSFENNQRHENWSVDKKCAAFIKAFIKHNNCLCYACLAKKDSYKRIINFSPSNEKSKQITFEF